MTEMGKEQSLMEDLQNFLQRDTAGTGRYVKNAAAWLVNYERRSNLVQNESEELTAHHQQSNKKHVRSLREKMGNKLFRK